MFIYLTTKLYLKSMKIVVLYRDGIIFCMIIGHLGMSYVLSQLPVLTGHPIAPLDQAAIVASGYVLDWEQKHKGLVFQR